MTELQTQKETIKWWRPNSWGTLSREITFNFLVYERSDIYLIYYDLKIKLRVAFCAWKNISRSCFSQISIDNWTSLFSEKEYFSCHSRSLWDLDYVWSNKDCGLTFRVSSSRNVLRLKCCAAFPSDARWVPVYFEVNGIHDCFLLYISREYCSLKTFCVNYSASTPNTAVVMVANAKKELA